LGGPYAVEQTTFALNLFRFLKRNAYDIVHLQDPFSALLLQRFRTLGLLQTLTVLTHGTEEPMEFQKKIDNLVHLAPWHAQQARLSHLDKSNWTMIPNFVDTSVFVPGKNPALRQEFNIPSDAFVIIVSSALKRKHKRIDFLIEEFARLRRAQPELPIWFLFAGGRERDTDALISQGKKLLGDRVRFIVSYPHARMPELLRAADLLVHGSLMEMMPMALLEALASGLPCLVHEHPVMQWMIGPGGMTLDLRSSGQLPEAIAKLVRSPQLSVELSQRARAQCEAYFSREKVVGDILRYYQVLTDRCSEQYRRSG
jgi:glycosyltransferase involved in cell wall biosynthesis